MTQPAATTQTRAAPTPTDVPVRPTRTVTYLFRTGAWAEPSGSETGLKIPYEVAFNGTVQRRARGWPKRIVGRTPFQIQVPAGTQVSLYLNTDSLEGNRQQPVYAVTPNQNDAHVTVTETRGTRPTTTATATLERTVLNHATSRQTDYYAAPLHGNIWAAISKIYSENDARALIPVDGDAGVREAVLSIYRVLQQPNLIVTCSEPANHRTMVAFADSANPRENVSNYDLLRDGLPRVHPVGMYALVEAARVARLTSINITSCWRPSLGSIAHRAGIGLDVNIIADDDENVRLNRAELIGRGPDLPWVSAEERRLYPHRNEGQRSRAAWLAEMEENKPALLQTFRHALQTSQQVQQLYDPWYIDDNTRDDTPPRPNEQTAGNPKTHNNHLHITVNAPGVL